MTKDKNTSRILIIDDNTAIHNDFVKILSKDTNPQNDNQDLANTEALLFGEDHKSQAPTYHLSSAYKGKQGLEMVEEALKQNQPYALAFVDILMPPGWDGIETIKHLWKADPCLQIAICSAHSDYSWEEVVEKLGHTDNFIILKKPFEPIEIQQIALAMTMKWKLKKRSEEYTGNLEEIIQEKTQEIQYQLSNMESLVAEKTKEIKQSEERYILAAKSANDGLWDLDVKTGEVFFSSRFEDILEIEDGSSLKTIKDFYTYLHEDDKDLLPELIQNHLNGQTERIELECRMNTAKGQEIWVHIRGLASYDDSKKPLRIVGYMTDISERKAHDHALHQAAFHDELTGLTNRALFMNRLEQVIARKKRLGESSAAIMFLDLNRFKSINDTLGHQIGDEVLKIVATVLKTHTRPTDTISRIGGDEFTVLLDPIESLEEAETTASRILEQLNKTYEINDKEVYIGSSIGLTLIDDPDTEAQIFLRNADLAMYQAKSGQKNTVEIFDQQKHNTVLDNMEIENDLRNAVKNDELLVYYQPIIDLMTGHVISFESLMRWRHPQRGFVSPGHFIPLAEELGLIGTIGLFTVESVCKQLRIWQEETNDCPNISLNVSVRQLMDSTMFDELYKTLTDLGDLTRFISVEVTETLIMQDPNAIVERLKELRALNMKIYIDDFGTGYSSLSYLATFPLDVIKIDQAFVASMLTDTKSERLVASIISLASELELKTVAEGVETEEQMEKLIELNCDFGQGHYFAKAMNSHVAREIVYNHTKFNITPTKRVA